MASLSRSRILRGFVVLVFGGLHFWPEGLGFRSWSRPLMGTGVSQGTSFFSCWVRYCSFFHQSLSFLGLCTGHRTRLTQETAAEIGTVSQEDFLGLSRDRPGANSKSKCTRKQRPVGGNWPLMGVSAPGLCTANTDSLVPNMR
jgi:hypothetical protein